MLNHPDEIEAIGDNTMVMQPNRDIDLNMPSVEANIEESDTIHESDVIEKVLVEGLAS